MRGRSHAKADWEKAQHFSFRFQEAEMNKANLLVVEDDPLQRKLIKENLEQEGYSVLCDRVVLL